MKMGKNITANTSWIEDYSGNYTNNADYYDYYNSEDYTNNIRAARIYALFIEPAKLIALVLGFFAVTLNVMSLLAMSQVKNRITSHHRLIISLAISDMLIGITVVQHFLVTALTINYVPGYGPPGSRCLFMATKALNTTGLTISLLNLMGMAIDHHMAIIRPLHYPSQMSRRKASIMIVALWVTATFLGFAGFLTGVEIYNDNKPLYNYCEATYLSPYQDEYMVFAITLIASGVMIYIYSRIYIRIKRHRFPGERPINNDGLRCSSMRKNISKNKQALMTTLLILGTFMVCWLPNCIYQIALIIQVHVNKEKLSGWEPTLMTIDQYFLDLLLLNSITDPIIYAVRMYDVQLGYKRLICKCLPRAMWTVNLQSNGGTRLIAEKPEATPETPIQLEVKEGIVYEQQSNGSINRIALQNSKSRTNQSNESTIM